jgi:hypothetical protein
MKRKMKVLAGIFVAGLLVLVALMKLGIVVFKSKIPPASSTTIELYLFQLALGQIVAPEEFTIEEMLFRNSTNDLHISLAILFEEHGFRRASHAIIKHDGWGRPYHVEWRTNLFGVDTPMIHANDNELLIWSAGSNGINEYGGGDDLFDDCDWQIFKHSYKQWLKEKENSLHEDE